MFGTDFIFSPWAFAIFYKEIIIIEFIFCKTEKELDKFLIWLRGYN